MPNPARIFEKDRVAAKGRKDKVRSRRALRDKTFEELTEEEKAGLLKAIAIRLKFIKES